MVGATNQNCRPPRNGSVCTEKKGQTSFVLTPVPSRIDTVNMLDYNEIHPRRRNIVPYATELCRTCDHVLVLFIEFGWKKMAKDT